MKRALFMMFCTLMIMLFLPQTSFAEETVDLAPHAKSALLMDVDTGTIIYSK
ncbi:MAG: D-alanyl-D-alanine carboxypeptidase, partial [Thermicanus sp.]|nr:D-alanyl-D-alanine carboxypeptidase [Thermicanus sp.]